MKALLRAEIFLISRQKRTYFGLAAILTIELLIIGGAWYQGSEIIDVLLDNLRQNFVFHGQLLNGHLILYVVLNSLWFNLPLIIMIIVSGFLTNDYKDQTLQTVMLQSVKKKDYIFAKYLAAIAFTISVVLMLALTSALLAYSIFGSGDLITYLQHINFFETHEAITRIIYAFASGTLLMVVYSVASITLGVIFKEMTITWIASALFLIICSLLSKIDFGLAGAWIFPELIDTWQYFFYYQIPWQKIMINQIILILYGLAFLIIGTVIFTKRDIG